MQQGQLTLPCPICRQVTPVPANGMAGLQPAFHINHLLDIVDEHKKGTEETDPPASEDRAESVSESKDSATCFVSLGKVICCPEHNEKEAELYCETCGELACLKCAITGGKHNSHNCKELSEAYERYKEEITSTLEPMGMQLMTVNKALAQLDTCCGVISDQRETIEADIDDTIRRLHEALDIRRTELIGQLHQVAQSKLKCLATQRDEIETTHAQLSSCLNFVKESLNTDSYGEVLMIKMTIVKQVKELTTPFVPDALKPNAEADMMFSATPDATTVCRNYGKVLAAGLPDPLQCYATGKGLEVAAVGETSTAVLQIVKFDGQPCKEPIKYSECELVSEITGFTTSGCVERRGHSSQYEISYQPAIKGRHQLHVKVEDQHIRGSPFSLVATSPVGKLGTPIQTIAGVKEPWGIAINEKGEVVVTEVSEHSVSVFSPLGKKLRSFGGYGSGQGQFKYPCGVVMDGEKNILVADPNNHRIQRFTPEGQYLSEVGTKGKGPLEFQYPCDIAFNATNGKVYVVDRNHHVHVLNSDFTFFCTFGKEGSGKGQFNSPNGVVCDSTGKVYVTDSYNHRIQVFTAEGKFLRMFGRCGSGKGDLDWPMCIDVDASGIVYVSEVSNDRVSVFTSEGKFVKLFGKRGEESGEFKYPRGLAVDSSGVVYVCDSENNCVQIF